MGRLGDTFKERRNALGITIEQAQEATRIRALLLTALEEGDYERLPAAGYVRGYISSYARFLELDPVPLLNMYQAETGATKYQDLNLPQTGEAVKPTGQQHAVPWRAAVSIALILGLLSLAIWGVMRIWRGPAETPPVPTPAANTTTTASPGTTTAKPQTTTESAQEPTEQVEPTPQPEAQPFTLKVVVATDAASWLRVTVDGKKAYEGTLAGGQTKQFEVAESAEVRIGKPESVTVYKDDVKVKVTTEDDIGVARVDATATDQ